jgi:hypothetical protein
LKPAKNPSKKRQNPLLTAAVVAVGDRSVQPGSQSRQLGAVTTLQVIGDDVS